VWLCLQLYEQRREPVLRAAREWLIGFTPRSFRDVMNVIEGGAGEDANRFFRQATSYWEMISALMMSAGVSVECRELFASTTREFFLCYAKLAPWLNELRAATRPNQFQNLERFCRSLPDHDAALAYFTTLNEKIRDRIARAKKVGKKARRR
jgi:hypothetical protein